MNIKITDVRCKKADAAFLLDDGTTSVLYDTGFGFTGECIADNVQAALGERKLDYIFLTHSHYDHALGSANVLRRYPDAKVVAGTYTVDIFARDGAKRVMRDLDSKYAHTCGVDDYEFLGDELRVDIPVSEGDVIKAGDMEFTVVNLPGHTRCCVGFFCEREGLFLGAETLGVFDGDQTILPIYLVSYADAIASMEKVEKLPVKNLVVPHWGLLNETETQFYLANMKPAAQDAAKEVLAALGKGVSEEEIVQNFKNKFLHGYIREIYPEDAITLNTTIMVRLIKKELFDAE